LRNDTKNFIIDGNQLPAAAGYRFGSAEVANSRKIYETFHAFIRGKIPKIGEPECQLDAICVAMPLDERAGRMERELSFSRS